MNIKGVEKNSLNKWVVISIIIIFGVFLVTPLGQNTIRYAIYFKENITTMFGGKEITAIELINEYKENSEEADKKYIGKVLKVKGKINRILNKNIYIFTDGKILSFVTIRCKVNSAINQDRAYGIKAGDNVTIVGKVNESRMGSPILVDCRIIK